MSESAVFQKKNPKRPGNEADPQLAPSGHQHGLLGWAPNGNGKRVAVAFDRHLDRFLPLEDFLELKRARAANNSTSYRGRRRKLKSDRRADRYSFVA
jgi:hypothetical protein